MTARILAALVATIVAFSATRADVIIRVLDANGPVTDAEITIEPAPPDGKIIDKVANNTKGEYLSKEIPKNHGKVTITVRPRLKSGLDSETIEAMPKEGEVVTIRLQKKVR